MNLHQNRRQCLATMAAACGATLGQIPGSAWAADAATPTQPTETSWASFRNGPTQRGIAGTKLADKPQLKWEIQSRDGWVATCAIVGDHVYAPALEGYLYCFDRESGKEIWKYRSIESTDEKKFAPGFKAAPLVTDTHVYVGDEDGILHAVNRKTGKSKWTYTTQAEIAGGVAVYKNELLLASHDSNLYRLTTDGQMNWQFATQDRINCSPAVADDFTFVSGCDQHLRIISLKTGEEIRDVVMESFLIASPAVVDNMLYIGSEAGIVSAVDWQKGEVVWRYESDRKVGFHSSAAVTDELVLLGGQDKYMHAIDRETGNGRWKYQTRARIDCSAAVVDERVFFGSADGNIYGLRVADGKEVWKFNAGKSVSAGIAIGEGCLVVGEDDHNGTLRCFG